MNRTHRSCTLAASLFALALTLPQAGHAAVPAKPQPTVVQVRLSEWKVALTPATVPSGPVVFRVTNAGSIDHAFEVEGQGVERSTPQLKPGADTALEMTLAQGNYETYCPVGKGSHRMLGMKGMLNVQKTRPARVAAVKAPAAPLPMGRGSMEMGTRVTDGIPAVQAMRVIGGGPVIQILPGPFPFADSALAVIRSRPPDQMADLDKKSHLGPYSNHVVAIHGDISLVAFDHGAHGDSVAGEASLTTPDGEHWRIVLDGVQTKDIPYNPRFGGVIMGLYYHGASNVHTPLVPTIQSSLALWAFAHVYKGDRLLTDHAMVHIMLLSRTRKPGSWALDCWDCTDRPVEELQLQVTPAPDGPPLDSPGGFLFVNWEKSVGKPLIPTVGERHASAGTD